MKVRPIDANALKSKRKFNQQTRNFGEVDKETGEVYGF